MSHYLRLLGAAAVIGSIALPAAAQPMRYSYETPEQNVAQSARYDRLLETNMAFRHYRMGKECSPIDFEQGLRQDCFGSFDQFEPVAVR